MADGSPDKKKDVVSRLTDTTKYTSAHKHRFDEEGKGKGAAGRADLIAYDGSTNAGQKMIASDGEKRKSVVKKWDGGKFGTQADKPRVIKVFRFGEKNDEGDTVVLNYRVRSLDFVLSQVKNLPTGRPKKLVMQDLSTRVKDLSEFRDGGHYLALPKPNSRVSPGEKGIPDKFEYIERKGSTNVDYAKARSLYPNLKKKDFVNAKRQFDVYDVDGSGSIDDGELCAALVQLGFEVTEEKMKSYIADFDADLNATLDIYEFFGVVDKAKTEPENANLIVQGVKSSLCVLM